VEPFHIADPSSLSDDEAFAIYRRMTEEGWIVVESPENADLDEALLSMQAIFGGVVFHPYSREEGVVVIDNLYRPPRAMLPHTDGTYYPQPPALMCLQCIIAATTGGASTLVDGAKLYDHLASELPDDLPRLFEPVLGVEREDHFVESPVFWRADDRLRIRFRIDETIKLTIAPAADRAVEAIRRFIEVPANQLVFTLQPRQTLIVDNTRMLHGRTAYDGREQRKMNRVHFDGRSPHGDLVLGFLPRAEGQA